MHLLRLDDLILNLGDQSGLGESYIFQEWCHLSNKYVHSVNTGIIAAFHNNTQ